MILTFATFDCKGQKEDSIKIKVKKMDTTKNNYGIEGLKAPEWKIEQWVDENGNNIPDGKDEDFKAGMFFSFAGDEVNIKDTGKGGYYGGYYWRQFDFGQYGLVWLSCWNKDDLVNYY